MASVLEEAVTKRCAWLGFVMVFEGGCVSVRRLVCFKSGKRNISLANFPLKAQRRLHVQTDGCEEMTETGH